MAPVKHPPSLACLWPPSKRERLKARDCCILRSLVGQECLDHRNSLASLEGEGHGFLDVCEVASF